MAKKISNPRSVRVSRTPPPSPDDAAEVERCKRLCPEVEWLPWSNGELKPSLLEAVPLKSDKPPLDARNLFPIELRNVGYLLVSSWREFSDPARPWITAAGRRAKLSDKLSLLSASWDVMRGEFTPDLAAEVDSALLRAAKLLVRDLAPPALELRGAKDALLCVAVAVARATDLAAKTPKADGTAGRGVRHENLPKVDQKRSQVQYCGEWYEVTPDGALLFSSLVDCYPQAFPATTLFSKPSRVKDCLPAPLKALIVAQSGKGYWLKLP